MGRLKAMPSRLGRPASRVRARPKVAEGFYQSAEWLDYRRRHRDWTRAKHGGVWCKVCGAVQRLILDHRVERSDGGADFPPYEEADWLCTPCHNRKTADAKARRVRGEAGWGVVESSGG